MPRRTRACPGGIGTGIRIGTGIGIGIGIGIGMDRCRVNLGCLGDEENY